MQDRRALIAIVLIFLVYVIFTTVFRPQRKPAPAPAPRELPKTGSRLPWLAVVGMIALAIGAGLTIRRLIVG